MKPLISGIIETVQSNPLSSKGEKHLISPYNITTKSHIKVTRIKEMITN